MNGTICLKIKEAKSILVIGGGAVGIEMAGEIKVAYSEKKVILMDRNDKLLSRQNVPKLRLPAKKGLEEIGVKGILGETIVGSDKVDQTHFGYKKMTTENGMVIESDIQFLCVGMRPNNEIMKSDANNVKCLEDGKSIAVKDTLQVDQEGYENVFVIGDASNHPTPKMAYWGGEQGKLLATSLSGMIKADKELLCFDPPMTEALILPIGPNGGLTQLPLCGGVVVGDFITRKLKSNDLVSGMYWASVNAKNDEV